jgi:hypothetical protein
VAAFSVLTPDIRVEIPEIPAFVAERQLLRALREFAEETRAWRVNIQVGVIASTATVDITSLLPTGSEVVDIISMKDSVTGGRPVSPTTFVRLDKEHPLWRDEEALNAQGYVLDGNNTLRFVFTPSTTVANKYNVRVALKPILATALTIDDVIANKYDELLVHGALARLYIIPRKPWTDANLALFHKNIFDAGKQSARTQAAEEFQTGIARKVSYGGL